MPPEVHILGGSPVSPIASMHTTDQLNTTLEGKHAIGRRRIRAGGMAAVAQTQVTVSGDAFWTSDGLLRLGAARP